MDPEMPAKTRAFMEKLAREAKERKQKPTRKAKL
jgi:hypothetical protein